MAKINNRTQDILMSMVANKFSEKRDALNSELDEIKNRNAEIYRENRDKVKERIQQVMDKAQEDILKLLKTAGIKLGGRYHTNSIITLFNNDDGKIGHYWYEYISSVTPKSKHQEELEADLNTLDEKCKRAMDELVLRANLGCKYDDVMEFINNLEV